VSKGDDESPGAEETMDEPEFVRDWLKNRIANLAGVSQNQINVNQPLAVYGMDSLKASIISGELEELLGRKIPPTVFYDNPSINEITDFLLRGNKKQRFQYLDTSMKKRLNEPVAVVGMACRFPGANDIKEFWSMLENGVDAIRPVPKNRWAAENLYNADNNNPEP
jgi:acyl carrier protein